MSRLMVIGLALGMLLFAAPASAQVCDPKADPKCDGICPEPIDLGDPDCEETKKEFDCSPGFWKTHLLGPAADYCAIVGPGLACPGLTTACGGNSCSCGELDAILSTGGGGTAATNRQLAADCLNAYSALIEFDPNCDEAAEE